MGEKHEIYCFNNGDAGDMFQALAVGDDGHVIAHHTCSSQGWMAHDLGITSDWKHENYNAHFGEGNWTLVWVDDPVNDERIKKAYELNCALDDDPPVEAVITHDSDGEEAGMTYKGIGYQTDFDPDERRDR